MKRIWKAGEDCEISGGGNKTLAVVILASPNGESLAVSFDGFFHPGGAKIGGYLEMMPLVWCGDHFEDFNGCRVEIEPRS